MQGGRETETERDTEAFLISKLVCAMLLIIILQLTPQALPLTAYTAALFCPWRCGTAMEGGHRHHPKRAVLCHHGSACATLNLPIGFPSVAHVHSIPIVYP